VRRSRPFNTLWLAIVFIIAWAVGVQWLATDACLDRGGAVTGFVCSNDQEEPWPLFSLISVSGALFVAAVVAGLVSAGWWCLATMTRRDERRDA